MDKEVVHAALDQLVSEHLGHYNVHCPHCGKANQVSRIELQRAAPDWKASENKIDQ
jgi:transposase-like protein